MKSDNLILMPEISATEAARNFSDLLDRVEEDGEEFTVIRRGRPVASITPVRAGNARRILEALRANPPDPDWADDLADLRKWLRGE